MDDIRKKYVDIQKARRWFGLLEAMVMDRSTLSRNGDLYYLRLDCVYRTGHTSFVMTTHDLCNMWMHSTWIVECVHTGCW